MIENYTANSYDLVNRIPHCPVIMILDTSHSMWGKGLSDLKQSLREFMLILCRETFQEAQIDIETIRMGADVGILEPFTPVRESKLAEMEIRPKGDTPLGASLEFALSELEGRLKWYRGHSISYVMPQMIILSDGDSGDDFQYPAGTIREMVKNGKLACHAIALGNTPNYASLREIAGNAVVASLGRTMKDSFRNVGWLASHEYEEEAENVILDQFRANTPADGIGGYSSTNTVVNASSSGTVYLLDGTNILHWGKPHGVSIHPLHAITEYLKVHGKAFLVLFDASTPYFLKDVSERTIYNAMLQNDPEHFMQVPAETKADSFLLEEARSNPGAVILTNDCFRDYVKSYPEILAKDRRIEHGMLLNNKIIFPNLNLVIPVPVLYGSSR